MLEILRKKIDEESEISITTETPKMESMELPVEVIEKTEKEESKEESKE